MDIKKTVQDAAAILQKVPGNHLFLLADAPMYSIFDVTDSFLEVTFCSREDMVGKALFDALPHTTAEEQRSVFSQLRASLQHVIEKKETHRMQDQRYDLLNPVTGRFEQRVWRPFNKPVFDDAGQIRFVIHTVEDVTRELYLQEESRLAGEKVRDSENRFRNMVEQAPMAILLTRGEDVVIESVNDPMLRFIDRTSASEILGKKMQDALPEMEGQPALQKVIDVQRSGVPWRGYEVPVDLIIEGKLKRHYFNLSYTPVIETGKVTSVLHVATDVTQQVETRMQIEDLVGVRTAELANANEALTSSNAELTRSNSNLEEFAHAVSHDLKEPLRKIHFYKKQLRDLLTLEAKDTEIGLLGRIEDATNRMGKLIEDLLQYSHVSQRSQQLESVNLNATFRNIREALEYDIQEKKAVLQADTLPVVTGSPIQLHQLFENILSNALKYSKEAVPPVIRVSCSIADEDNIPYHCIRIEDNGIGFDQRYAEQIFNMFSRLHNRKQYSGTGIGLAIVKRVLENHQGFIRALGIPGEGSTFTVYLPVS